MVIVDPHREEQWQLPTVGVPIPLQKHHGGVGGGDGFPLTGQHIGRVRQRSLFGEQVQALCTEESIQD